MTITVASLSKTERSIIVYAETCLVDHGGLLEGIRMNADDIDALGRFQDAGLLTFGRIPFKLIEVTQARQHRKATHWITFTDAAWDLAGKLRRLRSTAASPSRQAIDAYIAERDADEPAPAPQPEVICGLPVMSREHFNAVFSRA